MPERRQALKIIGSITATCAGPFSANDLYGQHANHNGDPLVQLKPAAGPRYFSDSEFRILSRLADLIIPATDTPGALAANVPLYMDQVAGANDPLRKLLRQGCATLRKAKFLKMNEKAQIAYLTPLCEQADRDGRSTPEARFFRAVKHLTSDGFFTSKAGLVDTLHYSGNSVLAEFPNCSA